jgi:hypothetical protein
MQKNFYQEISLSKRQFTSSPGGISLSVTPAPRSGCRALAIRKGKNRK